MSVRISALFLSQEEKKKLKISPPTPPPPKKKISRKTFQISQQGPKVRKARLRGQAPPLGADHERLRQRRRRDAADLRAGLGAARHRRPLAAAQDGGGGDGPLLGSLFARPLLRRAVPPDDGPGICCHQRLVFRGAGPRRQARGGGLGRRRRRQRRRRRAVCLGDEHGEAGEEAGELALALGLLFLRCCCCFWSSGGGVVAAGEPAGVLRQGRRGVAVGAEGGGEVNGRECGRGGAG